jgi:hypothetical protein
MSALKSHVFAFLWRPSLPFFLKMNYSHFLTYPIHSPSFFARAAKKEEKENAPRNKGNHQMFFFVLTSDTSDEV